MDKKPTVVGPRLSASSSQGRGNDHASNSPASSKMPSQKTPTSPPKTHSLYAILTTKRLVKRFTDRIAEKRLQREANMIYEPSYRMEPSKKFSVSKVESAMAEVIDRRMKTTTVYSPKQCIAISKVMSEEIKDQVKGLGYERYKLVCVLTVGKKRDQGLQVSSQCSWDTEVDTSATYSWQNGTMFCSAMVYGLYHE